MLPAELNTLWRNWRVVQSRRSSTRISRFLPNWLIGWKNDVINDENDAINDELAQLHRPRQPCQLEQNVPLQRRLEAEQSSLITARFGAIHSSQRRQSREIIQTFGWPSSAKYDEVGAFPHIFVNISDSPKRLFFDGVATAAECLTLIGGLEHYAMGLGVDQEAAEAGEVAVNPFGLGVEELIGHAPARVARACLQRAEKCVMEAFAVETVSLAGAMLTRLRPTISEDFHKTYGTPHVDKANRLAYDISTVLYLNDHASHLSMTEEEEDVEVLPAFTGGRFLFNDAEGDIAVVPKSGRLLLFQSGADNLHRVQHVTNGSRYTLALWFTEGG